MPARPKPSRVGPASVRCVRGPRNDGRWYWRSDRPDGKGGRTKLWAGWGTRAEAEDATIQALAGTLETAPLVAGHTVYDLLDFWLAHVRKRPLADATISAAEARVRHLEAGLGAVQLERLRRPTMERYRDESLRAGRASGTIYQEVAELRRAWAWGREVGLCPDRDLPRVQVKRTPTREARTPTAGEVAATLRELHPDTSTVHNGHLRSVWQVRAVLLMWHCGLRRGECRTLTWERCHLERRLLVVTGKKGRRTVPVSRETVAMLRSWEPGSGRLFAISKGSFESRLGTAIHEACDRAGVAHWSPQGLRRAVVDRLYSSGIDPAVAAAILGHSPQVALMHYRRVTEEQALRAVDEVSAALPRGDVIEMPVAGEEG